MSKTLTISQENFKEGLQLLLDDTKAKFGSARKMLNVSISDRGGITTRPGTKLLGNVNTSSHPIRGIFNFKKSQGSAEIPIKAYDTYLEFFNEIAGWTRLKSSFTSDQEFGFTSSLVNTDNDDFTYFCNRTEDFQRWNGAVTLLNGARVGGETNIPVDSVLKNSVYYSETATSNGATTITVSSAVWAVDMWKNFYIHIVGTKKVRKIISNTSNVLTFDTLGSGPGNVAFEIRQLAFPPTGTIIYNNTNIVYTSIDISTQFVVASAHASSDRVAVALVPEVFVGAPKGNRIESLLGRVFVGNVRSAVSRDSAGALQGSDQAGSIFVSKILNPSDFQFAATRAAGEGDIINMPYGGGEVTDLKAQESTMYAYKPDYIEAISYSQDSNDYAIRVPLKTGKGSVGKVIKGADDQYFMTVDKQYTSLGRVKTKDLLPQTENIGLSIKRLLDVYDHTDFNGVEFQNRLFSCHRTSSDETYNNVVLVFNKQTKSFEGIWSLPAGYFFEYKKNLYYAESNGANVWQMLIGKSDVQTSAIKFPVTSDWRSNFFNVLPIKSNTQAVNSIAIEGYIKANTSFKFDLYKDFSDTSSFSFTFGGTEEELIVGDDITRFMGSNPNGTYPLGTIDAPGADGRSRFQFIIYFPWLYGQTFSTGLSSDGKDQDWEIIRISLGLREDISTKVANIKS